MIILQYRTGPPPWGDSLVASNRLMTKWTRNERLSDGIPSWTIVPPPRGLTFEVTPKGKVEHKKRFSSSWRAQTRLMIEAIDL